MSFTKSAYVYSVAQIRQLEEAAFLQGITSAELMQRAARAVVHAVNTHFTRSQRIAVVVGSGHNGGDGLLVASLLQEAGYSIKVYYADQPPFNLSDYDLLIDAICGIGLTQPLKELAQSHVDAMNQSGQPILAIDVPTGIDADTGAALGRPIEANLTVTLMGIKPGLLQGEGIRCAGELVIDDLDLSSALLASISSLAFTSTLAAELKALPKRHANWHKGLSGHVLIVGGAPGFSGASKMAALAALRVGAGLVSVVMHADQAATFDNDHPEIMCHGLIEPDEAFATLLTTASVIVIGPGLGTSPWSQALMTKVLEAKQPLLLDADALNLLQHLNLFHHNWVLTPHPGEAARLLHKSSDEIQKHRLAAVTALADQYGGVVALKGARTLVSDGKRSQVSLFGNPGMASAGLGDVLSGMIGGLLAQGLSLWDATTLGVLLHAKAGDLAAEEGMRGLVATDLLPYVRQLINEHIA